MIVVALGGLTRTGDARAATSASYWASFPPGECAIDGVIKILAPTSVNPEARDTKIAWRAVLWTYKGAWVYANGNRENSALPWQSATVVGGQVYAPYNQGGTFSIYVRGFYAVTVEVYSYGLRKYFEYDLMLRVADASTNQNETSWCSYGM